ncbi:MAG: hypothetical protein ACNA7R_17110, partial [Natronococcus sp.]
RHCHPRDRPSPWHRTTERETEVRDRLLHVLREFTGAIVNPYDLTELLYRVTRDAVTVLDAVGAGIMLEDDDGELALGDGESHHIGAVVVEDGDETVAIEPRGDRLDLIGRIPGRTEIVAELWHGDRFGWDSPALEVEVVDDFEDAANHPDG